MSASSVAPVQVRAVSCLLPAAIDLVAAVPVPTGTLSFVQDGQGLVGWGEYARLTVTGPDAGAQIQRWFDSVVADLAISDEVSLPGSGPIVFVSLGFDDHDESVAVVPAVVLGMRAGVAFSTVIGDPGLTDHIPVTSPGRVSYSDGTLSVAGFTSAVAAATARIRADRAHGGAGQDRLQKVVLAHDLEATTENPLDERHLLRQLSTAYPSCWTYSVDGLVGASPEMLMRRIDGAITSRVLAGTRWAERAGDQVAADLMVSSKDLSEHSFAVDSVAAVLRGVVSELDVPDGPHPLPLANLTHLATDITGRLTGTGPSALELAAMLHPTAAVGGTPTGLARALIRELEPTPRGRYAAPVGWLDASGDGEFAIALRCASVSGHNVRMIAGCGIVADSDPSTEAREAQVKMIPIRDALETSS